MIFVLSHQVNHYFLTNSSRYMVFVHVGRVFVKGLIDAIPLDGPANIDCVISRHVTGYAFTMCVSYVGLTLRCTVGL